MSSAEHQHDVCFSVFTDLLSWLPYDSRAELWDLAVRYQLPMFETDPEPYKGYWTVMFDAWSLVSQVPDARSAEPLLGHTMSREGAVDGLLETLAEPFNTALGTTGPLVIDDSADFVSRVTYFAKHQLAGARPAHVVLDARKLGSELIRDLVRHAAELPMADKDGAALSAKVSVVVSSMADKDAVEQSARETGADIEAVLIWGLGVETSRGQRGGAAVGNDRQGVHVASSWGER